MPRLRHIALVVKDLEKAATFSCGQKSESIERTGICVLLL